MHALPARSYWFPVLLDIHRAGMLLDRLHLMWFGWPAVFWMFVTVGGGRTASTTDSLLKSRGRGLLGAVPGLSSGGVPAPVMRRPVA